MTDAADIVVTREDRRAACRALGVDLYPNDYATQWVETGDETWMTTNPDRQLIEVSAEFARHRVEAVRAFCEAHGLCEHGREDGCCVKCSGAGPRAEK